MIFAHPNYDFHTMTTIHRYSIIGLKNEKGQPLLEKTMKKFSRIIIFLCVMLLIISCSNSSDKNAKDIEIIELQNESQQIPLDAGTDAVHVDLMMALGDLSLSGSAIDNLLSADFAYNVAKWQPEVTHTGNKLSITQGGLDDNTGGSFNEIKETRNEWQLQLNSGVPVDLTLEMGAGNLELDLTDIMLQAATLQIGAAKTDIDLNRNWEHDLTIALKMGVGDMALHLPASMSVQVNIDGALTKVTAVNFTEDGDTYTNAAFNSAEPTLTINLESGIGNITLDLDE